MTEVATTLRDALFGSDDDPAQRERSRALMLKIQDQLAALEPAEQDEFDAIEAARRSREADHPARMTFSASGTIMTSNQDPPSRQPTWDELVEEHRRECEQTDEQIAAGWARLVAEHPEAEKLILHSGPVQRSPAFNKKLARFRARQKRRAARERAFGCSEISVRLWVPLWIVRILVALRVARPARVKVEPLRVIE